MTIATLGAGCFWCIEALLLNVPGILSINVGYSGGLTENPTYKTICSGTTGHAEVAQIEFDEEILTYEQLLAIFWEIHDPTTLNRQGNDIGTQYRSCVFCHDENQLKTAQNLKNKIQPNYDNDIVTEIVPFEKFYIAEDYHQDYFNNNKNQPYCNFVIKPKLDKFLNEKK